MPRSHAYAHWHDHANGVRPTVPMRDWLTDRTSLTYKLMAHCEQFRVQRLRQGHAFCLADEYAAIALPSRVRVQEREVVLRCDGNAMVFGHTVLSLASTTTEWPFFSTLGERSLGTTLFHDPLVQRGQMQYARLYSNHPLVRRMVAAVGVRESNNAFGNVLDNKRATSWLARRSTFHRKGGVMLVTEVFFPAIVALRRQP